MPVKLTLQSKVSDSLWRATGTFADTNSGHSVGADVIVKQDGKHFILWAEPNKNNGIVNGSKVLHYVKHKPATIELVKPGTQLVFNNILVTLKK